MENYRSESKHLGDDFFKKIFNIPIYQRLYVWENIQVKTLIDDLVRSYEHNDKHEYYLGGIVVVENSSQLDLIDGQQRFTTLKILREILGETGLTLNFIVRDDVWDHYSSKDNTFDIDIKRMREAKKELNAGLDKLKNNDRISFLNYLKEQVKLVVTIVPSESDLNKLFELVNGRGEQLQQHEILKAKFLSRVKSNSYKLGIIWDICANMDNFLEINIKKSLGQSWLNHDFGINFDSLYNKIIDKSQYDNQIELNISTTISYIIDNNLGEENDSNKSDQEDEASTQYLSIISFEMFLLYALVSFNDIEYYKKMVDKKRGNKQIEFKDKNLIQIFEIVLLQDTRKDSIYDKFIEHIFTTRVKFDNYIIKNHKKNDENSNETNHKISIVQKTADNKSRQVVDKSDLKKRNDLELLQSMLYHSHTRNTQEWIIPFLKNINKTENTLELLKDIDNFLYSQFDTSNTILERAISYSYHANNIDYKKIVDYLSKNDKENYHFISHYWFYKMDWIIWYLSVEKDEKFKFTARNSIEHIGAQNPDDENIEIDKVSKDFRHSFGNLFLVSVSQNSSVGNKGFHTKKAMFLEDKEVKNLKLNLISTYKRWGNKGVEIHFKECIDLVKIYFEFIGEEK